MANRPTLIEQDNKRFLIVDAPTDNNLALYLEEFAKYNVKHVVRVCAPTYSSDPILAKGMVMHEWPFADGAEPPDDVINNWLDLVKATFPPNLPNPNKETIAIHCVAGLGRAPVLVAIALIEGKMDPLDAVELIRTRRRGAINARQLKFLQNYQPRRVSGPCFGLCVVS